MITQSHRQLSHQCQQCGACCRWPGIVRLNDGDIDGLAAFLNIPAAEFTQRYTDLTPDRKALTLIESTDGACVMLNSDNHCRVHSAKPQQCKDFPLIWAIDGYEKICRGSISSNADARLSPLETKDS